MRASAAMPGLFAPVKYQSPDSDQIQWLAGIFKSKLKIIIRWRISESRPRFAV
jgi:hypothetical protein